MNYEVVSIVSTKLYKNLLKPESSRLDNLRIVAFNWWENDKIQVKGQINDYWIDQSKNYGVGTSAWDTAIYKGQDLIAIVQDRSGDALIPQEDFIPVA